MRDALRQYRFAICTMALFGLGACLAPGSGNDSTTRSFAATSKSGGLFGTKTRTKVRLARGDVVVIAPKGYCIESSSTVANKFALMAECGVLRKSSDLDPEYRGIVTVSVSDPLPADADMSAFEDAFKTSDSDLYKAKGVTLARFAKGGDTMLPGADPAHWRGSLVVNNRIVLMGAYGAGGGSMGDALGRRLLTDLAGQIQNQSPVRAQKAPVNVVSAQKTSTNAPKGFIGRLFQINQSDTQ